ncbi:tRNA (guanine(46)-N(7))-methyltransferase TrmB [Candidatus Nesciobacter abundans]|uniref:tRNA (guanine(46)-N(7))-methyltransferase n=1 Tax=Candidatus Nesciobacter abundans TaxID=2601668 RepID=A0A5C0UGK3_9PROT|nr:hypothetical protein [Candidatus Nesciobacter abundans]QEK39245.1 hypothetical protein FZC36_02310 [Candidatus Nesciobacter abundans]
MNWSVGRSRKLKKAINQVNQVTIPIYSDNKYIRDYFDFEDVCNEFDNERICVEDSANVLDILSATNTINRSEHMLEGINFYKDLEKRSELFLDLGFGSGDSLMHHLKNSDALILGCEIFKPGIYGAVEKINSILGEVEARKASERTRLFLAFYQDILRKVPNASVDKIFMLFPDPWPKFKHSKRRCYNLPNLDLLLFRSLKTGGKFIFASDIKEIADGMYRMLCDIDFTGGSLARYECKNISEFEYKTTYARKAFSNGRSAYVIEYTR